jgi:outer membrane protein TolC
MPTRDEFKGTWDIGVVLSMDLWNWGQTARQADQAEAALRQTELLAAQMEETVSLEVHRASLLASRAAERTDVAGQALRQAEEQSRMTEDKYRNGLATAADLLDAEVSLLQAKTTLSGARVEQEIARARLAKAAGSIVP